MKINVANECVKSEMIAWVQYPTMYQRECFVYPQYLLKDGRWFEIEKGAFPNNGSFLAFVTGSFDSQQIQDKYHSLVIAKINADSFEDNARYEQARDISSKYKSAINPAFHRGNSDLEFEVFSETPFSSELVQIVSSNDPGYMFSRPNTGEIVFSGIDEGPVCQNILVRVLDADSYKYYGPFEYAIKEDGALELHALDEFDFRVGEFIGISDEDLMTIEDKDQKCVASFINAGKVQVLFEQLEESQRHDWLPEAELIEALCRALGSMDDFKTLGKSQLRKMKSEIRLCGDEVARLHLDDSRKRRLNDAILRMSDLLSLDKDLLRPLVDQLDDERLARLVTSDSLFPELQERLLGMAGIREKIMEEERTLQVSLNELREQIAVIAQRKLSAEEEVRVAKEQVEEAKQEVEKVQNELLGQKREELLRLEAEIVEKKDQKQKVTEEYEEAIVQRRQARDALNSVFEGINDEVAASTKILESEVLKKVVTKVAETNLPQSDNASRYRLKKQAETREGLTAQIVTRELFRALLNDYGRECTFNDVANYMICIMQGYITTLAGMPGTGKTSLCSSICDVLGLNNPLFGNRFVEIDVENGWTSYKDYVGYYNPLSKSYEKSNTSVYDSMMILKEEHDASLDYPLFIYVLDEANLSSMEHYWSPFLRACDTFNRGTSLALGGPEQWQLPPHIRFLATVNFDHTTEALSPRFLDRSWVIVLDPVQIDIDEVESEESKGAEYVPFSYNQLMAAFGKTEERSISNATRMQYEKIMRSCRENGFNISPRSQSMILNYVSTAEGIMETASRDSQFAPLDYAIAQKILPLIYGPADKVGGLIRALEGECGQLQITRARLEAIRQQGNESGFYQFFA